MSQYAREHPDEKPVHDAFAGRNCKFVKEQKKPTPTEPLLEKAGLPDPTYNEDEIKQNKEWYVAWVLSQIKDDMAPIGWSKWIPTAKCLLGAFDMKVKR